MNEQFICAMEENKRLEAEKKRFLGVNEMLEQKIQVEKSEKMVLMSEVDHIDRHIGKFSQGKLSQKFQGRMGMKVSQYKKDG